MSVDLAVHPLSYDLHPDAGPGSLLGRIGRGEAPPGFPLFRPDRPGPASGSPFLDRGRLAAALAETHRKAGRPLSDGARSALRGGARLVLTGHQPVLLTGPMFTVWKILTAVLLARELDRREEGPVLPALWTASEDHDILEVNRFTAGGRRFVCPPDRPPRSGAMPPVSAVDVRPCRERLLAFLEEVLPDSEFRPRVLSVVARADFRGYGRQFQDLVGSLLEDDEVLLVDPADLRALTAPVLASLVRRWPEVSAALARGSQALRAEGLEPPLEDAAVFELRDGCRVKCPAGPSGLGLGRGEAGFEEAASEVEARPAAFSAGAALRPVLQDAVLPVLAYVGGPSELLYGWQIDPLFALAGVRRSRLWPRMSVTVVEGKIRRAADKAGLSPAELAGGPVGAEEARRGPSKEAASMEAKGEAFARSLEALARGDGAGWFRRNAGTVRALVSRALRKAREEEERSRGRGRARREKVAQALRPGGTAQERVVNVFHFLAHYGWDFLSAARERLDPLVLAHQVADVVEREEVR